MNEYTIQCSYDYPESEVMALEVILLTAYFMAAKC